MPWIGVERDEGVKDEDLVGFVEELGFSILGKLEIEVRTSRGWLRFLVLEVGGFVEGAARLVAEKFGKAGLESGQHLILGETSAKLWDEAVKVVFPDGTEEVIAVYTYDGFLDVRMPTRNVRGVPATMVIGGKSYKLPLTLSDLVEIYRRGRYWIEKIEKAASVYGIEKVISREALSALRQKREEERVDIDYETGFAVVSRGGIIRTVPIVSYVLNLVAQGRVEEAVRIYSEAPQEIRSEIERATIEEYSIESSVGGEAAKRLEEFAQRAGFADRLKSAEASGSP